jgi:hypothetical protein
VAFLETHKMIQTFESVFGGIDLPACISICDDNGLIIYSVGECGDQWLLESLFSYLIMSFESTSQKLNLTDESLDNLVIQTNSKIFYVDDIQKEHGLYMIVQTTPELMSKVVPFLKNIVNAIARIISKSSAN